MNVSCASLAGAYLSMGVGEGYVLEYKDDMGWAVKKCLSATTRSGLDHATDRADAHEGQKGVTPDL